MKIGTILGDYIGSTFENKFDAKLNITNIPENSRFTDDSVLHVAISEWLLTTSRTQKELHTILQNYWHKHSRVGYGSNFSDWAQFRNKASNNSYGNGAVMRISPVGWLSKDWNELLYLSKLSCLPTHNHEDSIKSAQAIAGLIYLGRCGISLNKAIKFTRIRFKIKSRGPSINWKDNIFYIKALSTTQLVLDVIEEYKDPIFILETLVHIGGDVDTNCAIALAIIEAFYPDPFNDTLLDIFKNIALPPYWNEFLNWTITTPTKLPPFFKITILY